MLWSMPSAILGISSHTGAGAMIWSGRGAATGNGRRPADRRQGSFADKRIGEPLATAGHRWPVMATLRVADVVVWGARPTMSALPICDDMGSEELRRRARRERDVASAPGWSRSPTPWKGWIEPAPRGWPGWTVRPFVTGSTATTRRNCRAVQSTNPGRRPKLSEGQMAALKQWSWPVPIRQWTKSSGGRIVDLCRRVAERWGVSYSETGMLRLLWSLDFVAPQDPTAPPAEQREGLTSLQKGTLAARLTKIMQAHPEAERFEIWSQDEARVGQKGRTGYVWWQRGQTLRGLRDVGHQSAWMIGAVCPARATVSPW